MRAWLVIALAGCWTGNTAPATTTTPVVAEPAEPVEPGPAEAAPAADEPPQTVTAGLAGLDGSTFGGTGPNLGPNGTTGTIGHSPGNVGAGPQSRPPPPVVAAGGANVTGALDKDVIRRVVRQNLPRIRYCYEKQLVKDPAVQGKVETSFVIDASGAVSQARAKGLHPDVEDCVRAALFAMKFPPPKGGGTVTVAYPFVFQPGT